MFKVHPTLSASGSWYLRLLLTLDVSNGHTATPPMWLQLVGLQGDWGQAVGSRWQDFCHIPTGSGVFPFHLGVSALFTWWKVHPSIPCSFTTQSAQIPGHNSDNDFHLCCLRAGVSPFPPHGPTLGAIITLLADGETEAHPVMSTSTRVCSRHFPPPPKALAGEPKEGGRAGQICHVSSLEERRVH